MARPFFFFNMILIVVLFNELVLLQRKNLCWIPTRPWKQKTDGQVLSPPREGNG